MLLFETNQGQGYLMQPDINVNLWFELQPALLSELCFYRKLINIFLQIRIKNSTLM